MYNLTSNYTTLKKYTYNMYLYRCNFLFLLNAINVIYYIRITCIDKKINSDYYLY